MYLSNIKKYQNVFYIVEIYAIVNIYSLQANIKYDTTTINVSLCQSIFDILTSLFKIHKLSRQFCCVSIQTSSPT
jgi:hypothetical protein